MDALVRVVLSVAILTSTQSLKAALSAPVLALTTVSLNEVIDLSVTSKVTDLKEPIRMDLSRSLFEPQHIRSADTDRDRPQGASSTSLPTPITLTMNQANTKIADTEDAKTDTTIVTDVLQQSKSIDSPETLNNASRDIIPSLVPLRSTTITQGSSIPSPTNHSEEHQNSSQAPTPETFPSVSLIPPSIPASTLKDSINRSASVENENQDEPSELDVGDENLDKGPSPFPLDPLLAGFISVFILSTAVLSILLFLKFRQQSSHPEFHRLQDLPMDDLLEDTPLSRYSY